MGTIVRLSNVQCAHVHHTYNGTASNGGTQVPSPGSTASRAPSPVSALRQVHSPYTSLLSSFSSRRSTVTTAPTVTERGSYAGTWS
jgi:hypothetical protein